MLVVLLLPSQAWAHLHRKSAFGAFSEVNGSSLQGFQLSLEFMLPKEIKSLKSPPAPEPFKYLETGHWSLFENVGINWGSHEGHDRRQAAFIVGGRYQFFGEHPTIEPFVHLNLGFVHTQDSPTVTDWASGGGGGGGLRWDVKKNWCIRVQVDYVRLWWWATTAKDYLSFAAGLEGRWGEFPKPKPKPKIQGSGALPPGTARSAISE